MVAYCETSMTFRRYWLEEPHHAETKSPKKCYTNSSIIYINSMNTCIVVRVETRSRKIDSARTSRLTKMSHKVVGLSYDVNPELSRRRATLRHFTPRRGAHSVGRVTHRAGTGRVCPPLPGCITAFEIEFKVQSTREI